MILTSSRIDDATLIHPDERRLTVAGRDTPPFTGDYAYVRRADGVCGVRYLDGGTDWFGPVEQAFGDYPVTDYDTGEPIR